MRVVSLINGAMTEPTRPCPVVLCILDGWGHREDSENNAIRQARTPVLDRLYETCPHALIEASEQEVGLPAGQMGNSEVGHMNLGAGRVVLQDLPRIDQAVAEGDLAGNPALTGFIAALKASGGRAHLMGLLSPGGVHSHQDQLAALAVILREAGIEVLVHGFLDGRDTPPSSARGYVERLEQAGGAPIATLMGRFFAMDRDQRWDRVARAYEALMAGAGESAPDALAAIDQGYAAGETDEFLQPRILGGYDGMKAGDGLLMANFRADRVREILAALLEPDFQGFARSRRIDFAAAAGMVSYSAELDRRMTALFPPVALDRTLGEVVAEAGLEQLRIAETEKYAHVTFFFNGGREAEFPGETRILVPSPQVATYDLQPEMSAPEVTDRLVEAVESGRFDLVVVNYANGDMVGHTGSLTAAVAAAECVDRCLGRLAEAVGRAGGTLLITADHGNAEQMRDEASGQAQTAHTLNPVPLLLVHARRDVDGLSDGRLADIAPTVLNLMGLEQPAAMSGRSLLRPATAAQGAAAE